jgi:uncharacterized protein (TIGR02271 family)
MRDTYSDTSAATTSAIEQGWDVYGNDDEHLGTVEEVGDSYVLIQKGLIFTKDIYVPFSAVTDASDGVVRVNVGKGELESMGWDSRPSGTDSTGYGTSGYAGSGSDASGYRDTTTTDTQRERMNLHEEELEARATPRQAGEVEVRKEVVEDQQTIEVPVRREEVHVRRVPADRAAAVDDASFTEEGETLRVPVMEEEVEVTKRPRVREQVEVEKVTRQDTEHVTDTVRREELDVSGTGTIDARSSYGASETGTDDIDALDDRRSN